MVRHALVQSDAVEVSRVATVQTAATVWTAGFQGRSYLVFCARFQGPEFLILKFLNPLDGFIALGGSLQFGLVHCKGLSPIS